MIKPTVGRIVWYYPAGHRSKEQPLAAIVSHVWSDTCVNLAIFSQNGCPMGTPPTSVLLMQDDAEIPAGGQYCTWMPFQKGQAAKTEAAEARAIAAV